MPELPEVETTCRGITPHAVGKRIKDVIIRNASLRWPVPHDLASTLRNKKVLSLTRRGKYLIFAFTHGHLLVHLGMSGSLRVMPTSATAQKHDHMDIVVGEHCLRFNDPRRFGCVLWTDETLEDHSLIHHLGPEPLTEDFDDVYLYARTRKRSQSIKTFIMDSKVVVGVGNIYANEALFNAHIHPLKAAGKLSKPQCSRLVLEIKAVLDHAITRGGTTLRDFVGGDGKPGYFAQELNVYGRAGEPCVRCSKALTEKRLGQRSTVYCTACQK